MIYVEARRKLLEWLRAQLIGPAGKGLLQMSPLERYPTAVLHPVETGVSGTDPARSLGASTDGAVDLSDDPEDEDQEATASGEKRTTATPLRPIRYVPPSSVGFSFCLKGHARLLITASAATYQSLDGRGKGGRFVRRAYERCELESVSISWKSGKLLAQDLWDGRARIHVRARPHPAGDIFTVSLLNPKELHPQAPVPDRIKNSLFEAALQCEVEQGRLVEYPRVDPGLLTDEERELELQYRERRIYALGHGAAADWEVEGRCTPCIRTQFMPAVEVPTVTIASQGDHNDALSMRSLATGKPFAALESFAAGYADWVAGQRESAAGYGDAERNTAGRMCERMETALRRMQRGVRLLRDDSDAAQCFQIANEAMLTQMRNSRTAQGADTKPEDFRWRPFQLAFLLTAMESTVREADDFRDVLDLIWFPTGGGKTEAYLGLIAFLVAWRRLMHGARGGGTVAFMRYTLRLLTRQQFERASGVMFALELIRRKRPELLGDEPITAGIWVGGAICPNSFADALEVLNDIAAGKPEARQKLVVDRCLWCRAEFDSERGSYEASEGGFQFHCRNQECEFGRDPRPLPCNVVDEALYNRPPTLLISTIDKFARLAWEARAGAFFGVRENQEAPVRPPELIIQDELHLVTGPLGSVAGVYEAGIDALLACRGVRPKYVASTATIRMAKEQVERLYARDLAVFPPPGLSCDDSWFARADHERPGRLYVGYLAPGLNQQRCLAPLAAALLAAPEQAFGNHQDEEDLLDAWWTLVVFHGSLKGVGNSHNAFMTDVRRFGRRLQGERAERDQSMSAGEIRDQSADYGSAPARFRSIRIGQLTSQRTAQENARTFRRLESGRGSQDCLDAVLATNMISVGLDVARLALMIVNGQPMTTAEYIQVTSRVGRGEVPGLVVANYFRHQARSLSHYEAFRPYHESFYRFVEPGSVTPDTFQVRYRALHAALVIALRHGCARLRDNRSAGEFQPRDVQIRKIIDALKKRSARAARHASRSDVERHIERLVEEWREEATRCKQEGRQLNFQAPNHVRNAERLLCAHGDSRNGLWRTLHSMRNVEDTGMFRNRG